MRSHGISSIISIPRGWEVWHLLWYPSHHRGVWAAPTVGNLLRADARHGQPMKFWWNRKFSLKHGKEIQYSKEVGKQSSELRMAAWLLHGACVGEEAGARNLVFFRVKWLQAAMKGTSCVRRLRLRSFHRRIGSSSVFCSECLLMCA